MNLKNVKKLKIPTSPGCYQFLDKIGKIIYIGKAANLKSRVLSYLPAMRSRLAGEAGWQKSAVLTPAKEAMLRQAKKIKWIETESEIEALLLEANLIKKHQPKFNVVLRDDKRFVYIKISAEEEWPRIFLTRKLEKAGKYFGPFTSVEAVRITLKTIRKIWPFRSCSRLPKKTCLYFRIGKCPGMCESKISQTEYRKIVRQIALFLEGRKKRVIKEIEKEIRKKKDNNRINFLKYQLMNLKKVLAHANILSLGDKYAADVIELAKILGLSKVPQRTEGYDISNIFGRQAVGAMVVFSGGEADKSQYRKFKIKIGQGQANDVGMLAEVLERRFKHSNEETPLTPLYKGGRWPLPDLIIVDGGKAQINVVSRTLRKFKLDIPALAISKGGGLRSAQAPDKIFFPGEKQALELPLASPALHIIKRVRDEAHRFAISYHRHLRKRSKFPPPPISPLLSR